MRVCACHLRRMALPPAAQLCGATGRSLAAQAATAPQPGAPLKHQQQQQQQDAAVTGHAVAQLQRQLEGALRDVEAYQQQHPAVANINKLTKRMRKDLASLSSGGTSSALRFSGLVNNLRGFRGEIMALQEALGVVAVCKRFTAPRPAARDGGSRRRRCSSSSNSADSSSSSEDEGSGGSMRPPVHQQQTHWEVEVDVVADRGLSWIEVKNQELFGVASAHFKGGSHTKGLEEQVQRLLAVAADPCNHRQGLAPQVVCFFPSGVDASVVRALEGLGAKVACGPGSLAPLCGRTSPPITNLDVTAMCALVSEVCWRAPGCEVLAAWAQRTTHWQDCLAAQQRSPLLPQLLPYVGEDRQLVASCAAVRQFQQLMDTFGTGPLERARWEALSARLQVYHPSACGSSSTADGAVQCSVCGAAEGVAQRTYAASQRLLDLPKLSALQRAVFGLSDAVHALTLTANGSAVRSAVATAGVELFDVVQHRPVWLTGL